MDENKPLPKQELLIKLLKMTASTNDGEALTALRKANDLLSSAGWDWEKLIRGKITVVADPFTSIPEPPKPRYEDVNRPVPPSRPRAPTAPPRPTPPPRQFPDMNGYMWATQAAADASNQRIIAAQKPKGLVNSTMQNRYPGDCWCCGDFVDSTKGWLFKPLDFNSTARTTARKLICTKCNDNTALKVPPTPARGKSAVLSDLI